MMGQGNGNAERTILHVDLDAFFAQAERLAVPRLRSKPLIVGGFPGTRGVVACASYEARPSGIHAGMSLTEAARRCPDAVFLPCHPARYVDLSVRMLKLLLRLTPCVEMASIDEAFLEIQENPSGSMENVCTSRSPHVDPSGSMENVCTSRNPHVDPSGSMENVCSSAETRGHLEAAIPLACSIGHAIEERLGLSASIGLGPNKLIAKMASGLDKPGGLTVLDRTQFCRRFHPEPVTALYGVGPATARTLETIGIRKIGQLASASPSKLRSLFGVWGSLLGAAARGEENSPVIPYHERPHAKSLGHEVTLPIDTSDRFVLRRILLSVCDEVATDLRREKKTGRTIHLKLRSDAIEMRTMQMRLTIATSSTQTIYRAAWRMLTQRLNGRPIRMLGVSVSGLAAGSTAKTGDLFDSGRLDQLDRAIDSIQDRFGRRTVHRASLLGNQTVWNERHPILPPSH